MVEERKSAVGEISLSGSRMKLTVFGIVCYLEGKPEFAVFFCAVHFLLAFYIFDVGCLQSLFK